MRACTDSRRTVKKRRTRLLGQRRLCCGVTSPWEVANQGQRNRDVDITCKKHERAAGLHLSVSRSASAIDPYDQDVGGAMGGAGFVLFKGVGVKSEFLGNE
ncbi:hypothetical protein EVAR_88901_1 [Eumeta japonica]|uniref:Uncharacterized protein n=1 Tax=Eumeta variegata TaxID=151549 RepID=A0A4C1VQL2_EUMVA|nr:hypothetical protein EVAR_88901_1 [Eumeta japonica]